MATPPIDSYQQIVFLTGAGISVASGLKPYRGPGGLWEESGAIDMADEAALQRDPHGVWRFFGPFRDAIRQAEPNPAHVAIARLETRLNESQSVTVITQNIDGLHQRAGSTNVIELHGSLGRTRCTSDACELAPFVDHESHVESLPRCPRCRSPLRPDIVLFGEPIPARADWESKRALRDCDLFIAVGTSGTVTPAANFVRGAEYAGARTVLVNLEAMTPRNPAFQEEVLGRAETVLPRLLA